MSRTSWRRLRTSWVVVAILVLLSGGLAVADLLWRQRYAPRPTPQLRDVAPVVEGKLRVWFEAWRQVVPSFAVDRFTPASEGVISARETPYQATYGGPLRERLYVYSPNRRRFLDPHTGLQLREEGGRVIGEFDVDDGVVVVDVRTRLGRRLIFCGTPCGVDDAVWADEETVVVAGYEERDPATAELVCTAGRPCEIVPFLTVFDLRGNAQVTYAGPPIATEVHGRVQAAYLARRYPDIVFR